MVVSEGEQADADAPGLPQLGVRLLLGALLLIALLLVAQRWGDRDRQERESFALVSGTIRIAELKAPVEILRDAQGIPHVISRSESEGWFGLGFAHAQDRLAQMDWLRRRATGRTAEIEGPTSLPSDRLARVLEIARASEAAAEALPGDSRRVLEAYAAGVNARIGRIRQGRVNPPLSLGGSIEEMTAWRPADSLAVGKLLSWCMGGTLETTLFLDDLIQRLGSVAARPFFPGRSSIDFGVAAQLPGPLEHSNAQLAERGELLGSTRALCQGIGLPTGGVWVIDGSKTESGAPILVADWHVAPSVPSLFYEVHLKAGGLDVAGATIPGSPILWAGRNRSFAWAGVPASAPISDLFIETLKEDRGLYQNGTLWVPIEERVETLRWRDGRGSMQESELLIRSTRHGPLIESLEGSEVSVGLDASDASGRPRASGATVNRPLRASRAIAWTGAREGDGLSPMLALLRQDSAEKIASVLASHHEPVLAIAYADREGRGGIQVAGWLPKRPLPTGLVPVQGRLRSFDWREGVSLAVLPAERLGESRRPWILAVDQEWPIRGGLDQLEWLWRPGDQAVRLESELARRSAEGPLSLRAAADFFRDDLAQRAPRTVASILGLARRSGPLPLEASEIAGLLERWDGRATSRSSGAAAYHLVIEHLLDNLLREQFGSELFERYLRTPHVRPQFAIERLVLRAAKIRRTGGWTDEERVGRAARTSLREAWVSLNHRLGPTRERWSWGRLHRLQFASFGPSRLSHSQRLTRRLRVHGSGQTLAFARHHPGLSFEVERAGLYRVAMDLSASDRLLSSLAPGQTEHPGHRHFSDRIARWAESRLSLFATNRLSIEEESEARLLLEPAP